MPVMAKIASNPGGAGVATGEGEGTAGIVHQTCP